MVFCFIYLGAPAFIIRDIKIIDELYKPNYLVLFPLINIEIILSLFNSLIMVYSLNKSLFLKWLFLFKFPSGCNSRISLGVCSEWARYILQIIGTNNSFVSPEQTVWQYENLNNKENIKQTTNHVAAAFADA